MDTMTLLSEAVNSIISKNLEKYKSALMRLINPNFDLFSLVKITGSEAKAYYGFNLHEAHSKYVRDLDVVLTSTNQDTTIFEILQETSNKLVTGFSGPQSSVPVYFEGEQKYKTALYSFAYPYKGVMRWVEVFAPVENVGGPSPYVPLKALINCAMEWKRDKDIYFLKQVIALTAGIELPETVASKAYEEFLHIRGEDVNGYSNPTSFNLNKLSTIMEVDRSKLQEALMEAHGSPEWICVAQKVLTVGEVKYLKAVFATYPKEEQLYKFIEGASLSRATEEFNKL